MFSKAGNRTFLNRILKPYQSIRPFSSSSLDSAISQTDAALEAKRDIDEKTRFSMQFTTLKQASKDRLRKNKEKLAEE